MFTYIYACTYKHMYLYTYARARARAHTHTHTHQCVQLLSAGRVRGARRSTQRRLGSRGGGVGDWEYSCRIPAIPAIR